MFQYNELPKRGKLCCCRGMNECNEEFAWSHEIRILDKDENNSGLKNSFCLNTFLNILTVWLVYSFDGFNIY